MGDVDDEWQQYLLNENSEIPDENIKNETDTVDRKAPIPTDIYISTKTEIAFLNKPISLYETFWNIDIISYDTPEEGIIKKQMKFISNTEEEYEKLQARVNNYKDLYIEQIVMSKMHADIGKKKYKDTRKISIGLCKKDLMTNRTKKKGAFYNCFVVLLRVKEGEKFKEYHVKVFNTGKIELPGIQTTTNIEILKDKIINMMSHIPNLKFKDSKIDKLEKYESILINSNFDCGFYLDRCKLFEILKFEYKLDTVYDSCSYPGVRCSFYYNDKITDGIQVTDIDKKISFMIFRTGSVLIVGKCCENDIKQIYVFIKNMLITEYSKIVIPNVEGKKRETVPKKSKKRICLMVK
jgi:hypothetical protein